MIFFRLGHSRLVQTIGPILKPVQNDVYLYVVNFEILESYQTWAEVLKVEICEFLLGWNFQFSHFSKIQEIITNPNRPQTVKFLKRVVTASINAF